ncbi:MAG: SAF domain-containing protein [Lachnospiraceae bacterium]|nr:SAF domain-containing protein [Lachnospiraceae bacterium]
MNKKRKEKRSILPQAAAGALLAAVIVFCIMLNVEKNAMAAYEKGKILVASGDIAKGTVLTAENADEYLEEKEIDKNLIPQAAIADAEQIYQQMTVQKLDKGTMITKAMLQDLDKMLQDMSEPVVAGFKAEDLYQVVSGTLRSGDRIHIYTVDLDTRSTYLVWENIFIREVFDGSGVMIGAEDKVTAAQRINIVMEKENVEQFYSELAAGSLRVVKVME